MDFVFKWLDERQPDVVGLQELKLTDEQFPRLEFEARGYRAEVYGQKSWNGVAVLSKQPARLVQRGLPGQEELGSRLITVEVEGLEFTTVYCPNGKTITHEDFPKKLAWFDALLEHLRSSADPSRPSVLCGDFNIVPEPIDSWNEKKLAGGIFHTDEERARMAALKAWGYRDVLRELRPEERVFSWWDYRGGAFHKKQGLRIDCVLATQPVLERATGATVDRDYRKKKDGLTASDHAPVMVDID